MDGTRFGCHKFVLAYRTTDIIESAETSVAEVVIEKMNKDVLQKFLEFVYTNKSGKKNVLSFSYR